MAKDTRRAAISSVRPERHRRGRLFPSAANNAYDCARAFTSDEISAEKQDASTEEVIPCRSLSIFPERCANLPLDRVESRSRTHPKLWPMRCRRSAHSIQVSKTASH